MKFLPLILLLFVVCSCQKRVVFHENYPEIEAYAKYDQFLSGVTKVTLYSTKSVPYDPDDGSKPDELFHGHEVMGKLEIVDEKVISSILNDIENNIYDETGSLYTMCFDPRHGVRVQSGEEVKDFQICFECSHLYVFDDVNSEEYIRIGLKSPCDNSFFNSLLDSKRISREKVEKSK